MICVCICTYGRPTLLGRLLSILQTQETAGLFDFSIVVVDNDRSQTARQTVEAAARRSTVVISYDVEPEQNIALARNRAIGNASGEYVALIDDDEFPDKQWLLTLYEAIDRC